MIIKEKKNLVDLFQALYQLPGVMVIMREFKCLSVCLNNLYTQPHDAFASNLQTFVNKFYEIKKIEIK